MADSRILELVLQFKDEATNEFEKKFGTMKNTVRTLGTAFTVMGTAMTGFGYMAAKAAGDIETQRAGFKTLLGSVEQADEAIKMIQRDAASTPFEFSGLVEANKSLTFVTKNAEKSEKVLLNVGKALAAAGKGQSELNNVIYNLQQIGNTGKITEMDIRQFGMNGINILEILAEYYGVTKDKAGEMVKGSENAFADLSAAFEQAGKDGGKFATAFADQAGTFNQMVSNLKDSWNIMLATLGAKLLPALQPIIEKITQVISKIGDWVEKNPELASKIILVASAVGALMVVLGPIFLMLPGIVLAFQALSVVLGATAITIGTMAIPVWAVIAAISALVVAGVFLYKHWDIVKAKAGQIWGSIAKTVMGVTSRISDFINGIWTSIRDFFVGIWQGMIDTVTTFYNNVVSIFNGIMQFFSIIGAGLSMIFDTIRSLFAGMWEVVKLLTALGVGIVIEIFNAFGIDIVAVVDNIKTKIVDAFNFIKNWVSTKLSEMVTAAREIMTGLGIMWNEFWTSVSDKVTQIMTAVQTTLEFAWMMIQLVWETGTAFLLEKWQVVWDAIVSVVAPIIEKIKSIVSSFWNWLRDIFTRAAEPVKQAWNTMWDGIKSYTVSAWDGIKTVVKESINWIIEKINWFIKKANEVAQKGAGALGISIPVLPEIPRLAKGGIVTRPTIAQIGEAGPEAIIPLNKAGKFGGGAGVTIEVHGGTFIGQSPESLAELMGDYFMDKLRANGRLSI